MEMPLLQTKLYIPSLRTGTLVSRSRLIDQLNVGLDRKLTLISAPAGFGKTTLVSAWLNEIQLNDQAIITVPAWLSLDDQDNDLVRFFMYLVAAFQQCEPAIGQSIDRLLTSGQKIAAERLMTVLINDIAQISQSIVLIFDDYHHIREQEIHDGVAFLLDHCPPNLHLMMTTRRDPPLPLARLRVRSQLAEIREQHLRFTDDEAAIFFQRSGELDLDGGTVQQLRQRTEGWVAGLQMAAISLLDTPNQADFVEQFAGSHRYVADYLIEEVLARQPEARQAFLLKTAVLDRFNADLCRAVTDEIDSEPLLTQLEQANLFLIPLDANRNWYRYHHLFLDFLRHRLQQQHPDWVPQLCLQASRWFEQQGLIAEAIDLALQAPDFDRAATLIEQTAQRTIRQYGQWLTLLKWLRELPTSLLQTRPRLCLHYAWVLMTDHQRSESEQWLQFAEQSATAQPAKVRLTPEESKTILGTVAAIRSTLARLQARQTETMTLARQALALLPQNAYFWRAASALNLGTVQFLDDDGEATEQALLEAQSAASAANNINFHNVALCYQAQLYVRQGRSHEAEMLYQKSLDLMQSPEARGKIISSAGTAYIGLGDLHYHWNDLDQAMDNVERGLALGEEGDNLLIVIAGRVVLAKIKQAHNDLTRALEINRQIASIIQSTAASWTWLTVPNAAALAKLWLRQGQQAEAAQLIQHFQWDELPGFVLEGQWLTQVRLSMAQERFQDAVKILSDLAIQAEATGRNGSLIEIHLLQALSLQALNHLDEALSFLERGLTLAEPSHYLRLFLDEGEAMATLLHQASKRNITPTYTRHLLSHFNVPQPIAEPSIEHKPVSQDLVDPLSDRELQILRLMAARLSNPEIASELYLATTTIKWYSRQIYSKLGVNNRRAAVERAKELNLL